MIGNLDALGPWQPGEDSRYLACELHRAALDRMEFDDAWEYALACPECVAAVRE